MGLRYLTRTVDNTGARCMNNTGWTPHTAPQWAIERSWKSTVFPAAMRWGWRGALDGFSGDIHKSLGGIPGGVVDETTPVFLDKKDMLMRLYFQVGCAYAVGW